MVNSLPCATYTKNEVTDTRIGAHVQMNENNTELIRAATPKHVSYDDIAIHERQPHTLDHPLHFHLARVESTLDPAVLPSEELDELDRTDQLVQDTHALVARGREALLDADGPPRDEVIERPAENEDDEACEGGPSQQPAKSI